MKQHRPEDGERTLAVFIDFENLALGFAGRRDRFQIGKVLERLVEKGKIVAKKAYCDWSRFGAYAFSLHECAIELIEIPKRSLTGKNSADIRLVVDAVDLAYSKDHIDTFVIVSGDSDFSPLVSKLKELGKHVIGLGLADATSELLRDNCDEFIYYEDLDRPALAPISESSLIPESKRKVFSLLIDSLLALRRENKETIFSSMAKDTMKRKKPSFNEEYHGYRTFSELLEDAARHGLVEIEKHKGSGTYVVTRFGNEMRAPVTQLPPQGPQSLPGRAPQQLPAAAPLPPPVQQQNQNTYRVQPSPQVQPQPFPPAAQAPPPQQVPVPPPPPRQQETERPPNRGGVFIPGVTPPTLPPTPKPTPTPTPVAQPQPARPSAPPPPPPISRTPAGNAYVPPSRDEDDEDDDTPTLGRSLIDEVDEFDDDDDIDVVPSYGPGRSARPATPAKPPEKKPSGQKPQQQKPAQKPQQPPKKPQGQSAPPARPQPQQQSQPARPATPPPPPPPPARPKPKIDDDDFGAGLDD
jgi:uncharacterized protein (TIGR00288 family)